MHRIPAVLPASADAVASLFNDIAAHARASQPSASAATRVGPARRGA